MTVGNPPNTSSASPSLVRWGIPAFLILGILLVFWPVTTHTFLNYDDHDYVTENSHVRTGLSLKNIAWAFTATHSANWHPVTWISHMLDVELFGMNAGMHHLMNLILHILNTLLLYTFFKTWIRDRWPAAVVAALFALHPLHVESVAWLAERKDVLSTFFAMLTLHAYGRFVKHPGGVRYATLFVLFLLALMAKPMVVTLPFVLLLIDYWPLDRITGLSSAMRQAREKVPLFMVAVLSSGMTLYAQQGGGAVKSLESFPFTVRVANALIVYVKYMVKSIWPLNLTAYYPHPGDGVSVWQASWAALLLLTISGFVIMRRRSLPHLLMGWMWYLGTLIPVIGLIQVGDQQMADRYTYVPLIGLFIMIAWSLPLLRLKPTLFLSILFVLLSALSIQTTQQVRLWRDDLALFRHMVAVTEGNYRGHHGLGFALAGKGMLEPAIREYKTAIRLKPDYDKAFNNLGIALLKSGKPEAAAVQFKAALRLNPTNAKAHNNLGVALMALGQTEQAISHFQRAVLLQPGYTEARLNLTAARN